MVDGHRGGTRGSPTRGTVTRGGFKGGGKGSDILNLLLKCFHVYVLEDMPGDKVTS